MIRGKRSQATSNRRSRRISSRRSRRKNNRRNQGISHGGSQAISRLRREKKEKRVIRKNRRAHRVNQTMTHDVRMAKGLRGVDDFASLSGFTMIESHGVRAL